MINEKNISKCKTKKICQIVCGIFCVIYDIAGIGLIIDSIEGNNDTTIPVAILTFVLLVFLTYLSFLFASRNSKIIKISNEYKKIINQMNEKSCIDIELLSKKRGASREETYLETQLLMDKGIIKNVHIEESKERSNSECDNNKALEKDNKSDSYSKNTTTSGQINGQKEEIDIFDIK